VNCEFQTLLLKQADRDCKSFCSTHNRTAIAFAALFNRDLVLYMSLIIIIIIIIIYTFTQILFVIT